MVQDFVAAAYRWVLGTGILIRESLSLNLMSLLAAAIVWLAYRRSDPEGQRIFGGRLRAFGKRFGYVLLATVGVIVMSGILVQARKTVETRRQTIQFAAASRRREPNLSGIVQFAPVVAVMEEKTYTRRLSIPPYMVSRIGVEGLQVLSPYLQAPSAENVTKIVDSFKRSGQDVIFTRDLTRRDEVTIAADTAEIRVGFADEGAPSGRRHYLAEFTGEYRFRNPRSEQATMRFAFALPQGGGTVQEFYVQIGETRIVEPDARDLYAWEGPVAPGAQVTAKVHYKVTGAAAYDYRLGSERRRIGDFHLVTNCPQAPQFAKSGIYPSRMAGSCAEWRLRDVLTSQSISLVFPRADLNAQLLDKSMSMLPVALALFALGALWIVPARAVWAVIAFAAGLLAVPVMSAYLPPNWATLIGAALAVLGGGLVLRDPKGWIAAILAGVSGRSMDATPSASATALARHTGVDMQLPSPTPFLPSGVKGEGVSICRMTGVGTSIAVGTR